MNKNMSARILSGALAVAAVVAVVAPAEAAVYRGRFDPVYGAPFESPSLQWGGRLQITVSDDCVKPGIVVLSASCSGGFEIDEALVGLFPSGTPIVGAPLAGTQQIMDFGAATSGILGLSWVLEFDNSEKLIGVRSTAFSALPGTIGATELPTNGDPQAWFSLQFLGDYAQLYWFDQTPTDLDVLLLTAGGSIDLGFKTLNLPEGLCRSNEGVNVDDALKQRFGWFLGGALAGLVGPEECGWSDPDNRTAGAFITFEEVPEPATYALVPAALALMGAAGVINRRRRSAKQET